MMQFPNERGFTLIELIIVIVILGILAVTALPRFIDFSSTANQVTTETVGGAFQETVRQMQAVAVLEGVSSTDVGRSVNVPQFGPRARVNFSYGYPNFQFINRHDQITNPNNQSQVQSDITTYIDLNSDDWIYRAGTNGGFVSPTQPVLGQILIARRDAFDNDKVNIQIRDPEGQSCHFLYEQPTAVGDVGEFFTVTGGC